MKTAAIAAAAFLAGAFLDALSRQSSEAIRLAGAAAAGELRGAVRFSQALAAAELARERGRRR